MAGGCSGVAGLGAGAGTALTLGAFATAGGGAGSSNTTPGPTYLVLCVASHAASCVAVMVGDCCRRDGGRLNDAGRIDVTGLAMGDGGV